MNGKHTYNDSDSDSETQTKRYLVQHHNSSSAIIDTMTSMYDNLIVNVDFILATMNSIKVKNNWSTGGNICLRFHRDAMILCAELTTDPDIKMC